MMLVTNVKALFRYASSMYSILPFGILSRIQTMYLLNINTERWRQTSLLDGTDKGQNRTIKDNDEVTKM
jgi:hypothetical protein